MPRQTTVRFPVTKRLSKRKADEAKFKSVNDFDSENAKPVDRSAKRNLFGVSSPKRTKISEFDSENPESTDFSVKRNLFGVCSSPKKIKVCGFDSCHSDNDQFSLGRNTPIYNQGTSPLQTAKHAFHTSLPSRLVGRQEEMDNISRFLNLHLQGKKSGSLYISGAPGTGKTSSLMHVLNNIDAKFQVAFINCMTVNNSSTVYSAIAKEFGVSKKVMSSKSLNKAIESHVTTSKVMSVLVLDEIDQLDSKGQEVLYSLFQLPQLENSMIVLIGIANALDLTDRILPRLHAFDCKPTLMHFCPYSKEQIVAILEDRLSMVQCSSPVIKPLALQLCARKIAACTGDVRKALDVCRRSIEIAEKQTREEYSLQVTSDDRCNPGSPQKRMSPMKPVDLPQINAVLHEVYGSRMKSSPSLFSHKAETVILPLQQLMILCTLILVKKCSKVKDFNLGKLYDAYRKVCRKRQISNISETEFHSVCHLIESRGLVEIKKNKVTRLSKVTLKVEEGEIEHLMHDKTLLSAILNDSSVIAGLK